jgi:hypothetical protein
MAELWMARTYVITICTKNRNHYFGEIRPETADHSRNKMILSNCGILVDVSWYEILKHTKNVELGAFTVMPNHMHGILILKSDSHTLIDAPLDIQFALDSQSMLHWISMPKNQYQNCGIKIKDQIRYHPLLVRINRLLHATPIDWGWNLDGKLNFTTLLCAAMPNSNELMVTSNQT